jgi:hypothetical protein
MHDHESFSMTDPVFYDSPTAGTEPGDEFLPADRLPLPDGWRRSTMDIWTVVHHDGASLPSQGWKIHVSATPGNARRVLERTWDHCISAGICFKFLRTAGVLVAQNTKYADRGGSGKFLTLYPVDEAQLEETLRRLGDLLRGEPGPYVLSDLRWEEGPLHVRYGGFVDRRFRDGTGRLVAAIEDPDGNLVPDERQPVFRPPPWVELPPFLAEQVERAAAEPADELPYDVVEALHFSNGGGVYRAVDRRTGDEVVLKEARPHAGLDRDGGDAVARLEREHRILSDLDGLGCVPAVHDHRRCWEHWFLVEELIEGETVSDGVATRHPLLSPDPTVTDVVDYTDWALGVCEGVGAALDAVHARGVVFGDLHPRNVVVRPDGRVALVDFELASRVDEGWTPTLGAVGFSAPPGWSGPAIDRFALGCLRLSLFLPLTPLLPWDPDKLDELVDAVERRFPVPAGFGDDVRRDLGVTPRADRPAGNPRPGWREAIWPRNGVPSWEPVRDSMAAAILASATPERADRLFPGDPRQFAGMGGLGMAHGAAGVLWALDRTGTPPPEAHVDWLLDALGRLEDPVPGFYDGLAGIAYALDHLGRRNQAVRLMDHALGQPRDPADPSLFGGLAGIGLGAVHLADGGRGRRYLTAALDIAAEAVDLLDTRPGLLAEPGLLHGWSGVALLCLRLHERTGDPSLLDAAERAVDADLAGCTWTGGRTLQVDQGWRVLPYLAVGSAGIGMVLRELLTHRPDEARAAALEGIRRATRSDLVIQAGLFDGRAGLLLALGADPDTTAAELHAHLVGLAWHAVPFRGHVAFVGDQLLRLSMDLATGSAGVLLALGSVLSGRPLGLPFLPSASSPPSDRPPGRFAGSDAPRATERR